MGIETKYYTNANEPKSLGLASAAVGQIAKITAVDESGVPTAWSPADMPSGGGSADAVLYTAQTLTDEQKRQARTNIDASSDFVTTITLDESTGRASADKTFAEISAAASAGKRVFAIRQYEGVAAAEYYQLTAYSPAALIFSQAIAQGYDLYAYTIIISADNRVIWRNVDAVTLNSDESMSQQTMASNPTADMEIATKKYVDDHATGMDITGATVGQIAKITAVDASGTPTAWEPADMPSGGGAITYDIAATAERSVQNNALQGFKCSVSSKQLRKAIDAGKTPRLVIKIRTTTMYMPMTNYFLVGAEYAYVNFGCVDEYGLVSVVCDGESEMDAGKPIWLVHSSFVTPTY